MMSKENTDIDQGTNKALDSKIGAYHENLRHHVTRLLKVPEPTKSVNMSTLDREFFRACERGNPETLKIYFDAGMDVNFQDSRTGKTALHISSAARARDAVRVILATGKCDFLIRDKKGRLPSEMAYIYGNDPALARLLGNKERKQAEAQGIKLTRRPPPKP